MCTWAGKLWGWLTLAAFLSFNATAATYYVNVSNTVPASPFSSWATAATNIQDAVDVSSDGDLILVTNGVYAKGGRVVYGSLTNRLVINKAVTVQSVNGPEKTLIVGNQIIGPTAVRCAYLTNEARLFGFTLTNGATSNAGGVNQEQSGGGVWSESTSAIISNCVVTANSAFVYGGGAYGGSFNSCVISSNSAATGGGTYLSDLTLCLVSSNSASNALGGDGGGCYLGRLRSCIIKNNYAAYSGGGTRNSFLNNCLILSNYVGLATGKGGGAYGGSLTNCIVKGNYAYESGGVHSGSGQYLNCIIYSNSAPLYPNFNPGYYIGTFISCCTTPLPLAGAGNFTNEPAFVNPSGGDYNLQSSSCCINAGNNAFVSGTNDLGGNSRIIGGTVDVGAYEFKTPASTLSYVWAQQYGLPTDGSADTADTDGDQASNYAEWKSGTVPTNAASVLQLASPTNGVSGMVVTWQSVSGITYYLQRSSDLAGGFTSIVSNLVGQAGSTSYPDTTATNAVPYFYRVGVQ